SASAGGGNTGRSIDVAIANEPAGLVGTIDASGAASGTTAADGPHAARTTNKQSRVCMMVAWNCSARAAPNYANARGDASGVSDARPNSSGARTTPDTLAWRGAAW